MAQPYLGEIKMFAGNFAPRHYAYCDGTLLSVAQNAALFSLLGTIYGGDGRSNFAIPEMRGRVPIHVGTGPGLTPRTQGQVLGTEFVTLSIAEMASHNHAFYASTDNADSVDLTNRVLGVSADTVFPNYYAPSTAGTPVEFRSVSMGVAGSGEQHINVAPVAVVHYVIAMQGVFPPRN